MITNIDELITLMDAEAAKAGREESEQNYVNGPSIKRQWDKRESFPYEIFYLVRNPDGAPEPDGTRRASFEVRTDWFDEEGNVTERPERND